MDIDIREFDLHRVGNFTTCMSLILVTVMILSFRTEIPVQTVQTQITLQSDQGLLCLPFRLHRLDSLLCDRAT